MAEWLAVFRVKEYIDLKMRVKEVLFNIPTRAGKSVVSSTHIFLS